MLTSAVGPADINIDWSILTRSMVNGGLGVHSSVEPAGQSHGEAARWDPWVRMVMEKGKGDSALGLKWVEKGKLGRLSLAQQLGLSWLQGPG